MISKYINAINEVYSLNRNGLRRALVSAVGIAVTEVGAMYAIFMFLSIFFSSNNTRFNNILKNWMSIDPSEHRYLMAFIFLCVLIMFMLVKMKCVKTLNTYIFNTESILSSEMVSSVLKDDYINLKIKKYSDINKLIFSDAGFIIKGILSPLVNMVVQIIIICFIMTLLIYQSFLLSISSLFLIVLIYLILTVFSKSSITKSSNERHVANNKRFEYLDTIFSLRRQIKLKNKEEYFINKFKNATIEFANSQILLNNLSAFPRMIGELAIGLLAIVFVAITTIDGVDIRSVIPTLGLFLIGAYKLIQPLQTLFSSLASIRHSWPAFLEFRNAGYFIKTLEQIKVNNCSSGMKNNTKTSLQWKKIYFSNISYSISNGNTFFELNNISFQMKIGEVIGIVGKSGSGKSTLIDIISGLIMPGKFQCCVDNDLLLNFNQYSKYINLNVGYVPHDFEILPASIYENIGLGSLLSFEELKIVEEYLSKMELDFLIKDLYVQTPTNNNLLNTLSEGQKQRIAFIRSIYQGPKLLVLDEFTSALDANTEGIIIKLLNEIKGDKFILMVSHRKEPLEICDRKYLLNNNLFEEVQ